MRTYDMSPLMRSAIGFDRMANLLQGGAAAEPSGFPPYDIAKTGEDTYRVSLAVAGFGPDDLEITTQDGTLSVSGNAGGSDPEGTLLHRGIARRTFRRSFALADHIKVADARLENGLLHIDLQREVPEEKKPRRIEIAAEGPPRAEAAA